MDGESTAAQPLVAHVEALGVAVGQVVPLNAALAE